jgi:hypothetical protein
MTASPPSEPVHIKLEDFSEADLPKRFKGSALGHSWEFVFAEVAEPSVADQLFGDPCKFRVDAYRDGKHFHSESTPTLAALKACVERLAFRLKTRRGNGSRFAQPEDVKAIEE